MAHVERNFDLCTLDRDIHRLILLEHTRDEVDGSHRHDMSKHF